MYSGYIAISIIILLITIFFYIKNNNSEKRDYNYRPSTQEDIAKDLGEIGEEIIKNVLGETIPGRQYINNLILKDEKGYTTQIDHILINPKAIFVIETKNLSGRIYGNENQKQWTQVLAYGEEKHKLYNPIKQNENHIYKLKKITKTELPIKSIIVFAQDNTKYINSENVFTKREMIYEINSYVKNDISKYEMENFYNQLQELKANQITDEEHIRNIKSNIQI